MSKRRITVTLDVDVVDEITAAVAAGQAGSVSSWVDEALSQRLGRERRLRAMAELVEDYEARHGTIDDDELAEQERIDRDDAARSRAAVRRAG